MSFKGAPLIGKTSILRGPELHKSTGDENSGAAGSQSHLETWCEALSSILVFWAALRAKPDVLTYHVILQTVFKIGVVFGLTDEILRTGVIFMMSEVSF